MQWNTDSSVWRYPKCWTIPIPILFSGTKYFRYRYRYFFSVPNFSATGSGTFFRYQFSPIPVPRLFTVPNISDTGSNTTNKLRNSRYRKLRIPFWYQFHDFFGTRFFWYRFRDFFPVLNFPIPIPVLFFRYQIFPIPVPIPLNRWKIPGTGTSHSESVFSIRSCNEIEVYSQQTSPQAKRHKPSLLFTSLTTF